MKELNLVSVLSAHKKLNPDLFNEYLEHYSVKIRIRELQDLEATINHLRLINNKIGLYDKFFLGYSVPQIGKEFDLLRIDEESVVNIEFKSTSTPEKIKAQLVRNAYYLSFLKKEIYSYCYITDVQKFYTLAESQNVVEVRGSDVITALDTQNVKRILDIDSYFNPANYLVSPFNSTQEFIDNKYFLTQQQEEIKNIILDQVKIAGLSILGVKGRAGTGKTLLTFDIAKACLPGVKVLIIHCGFLNEGHRILQDKCGWKIIPAKNLFLEDLSAYHLIVVDEAQRIYQNQLAHIIKDVKKNSGKCIFSYDGVQTLKREEIRNNIGEKIEIELTGNPFELTEKIRTNKEVASFIQCLFNKDRPLEKHRYSNIEFSYFENYQEAKNYLRQLRSEDWKIINYTPSNKIILPYEQFKIDDENDNAHTVIGQEFNNVVAIIDNYFYYKENGALSTKDYRSRPFYHPTKMLFQIVSRTRLKLHVIIIDNSEILSRCLDILKQ